MNSQQIAPSNADAVMVQNTKFQRPPANPTTTGHKKPAKFPIMFMLPEKVPANRPPTSMHAPQPQGIVKSLNMLAAPSMLPNINGEICLRSESATQASE